MINVCSRAIILFYLRETPQTDKPTGMTADDTALCISGIVLGMTGLRLWLACGSQRKHTYVLADTLVITCVIPSVMGGLARVLHDHWSTSVPKYTDV